MLGVGIDWAEDFHLVALGRPGDGVIDIARVEHHPRAINALVAKVAELEPDPAEVRVVIESRHGLLVERLVDAGYIVVPVNPDLIARRRGPAKKKDDSEDAGWRACWHSTVSSVCARWSLTVGSPASCAPSPGTTSALRATNDASSTDCAKTSLRRFPRRSTSQAMARAHH